jgi:hypothetical protein
MTSTRWSKMPLDIKLIGMATAIVGIDAIIVPIITDGKTTLHEYLGLTSGTNYKTAAENTSLILEKGLWSLGTLYTLAREGFFKYK